MVSGVTKWNYHVCSCWYEVVKRAVLESRQLGLWKIDVDGGVGLNDVLNRMGSQGWELVAVHPSQLQAGDGGVGHSYRPSFVYVFKRAET